MSDENEVDNSAPPRTYYVFVALLTLVIVVYYVAGGVCLKILSDFLPLQPDGFFIVYCLGSGAWAVTPLGLTVATTFLLEDAHAVSTDPQEPPDER